MRDEPTHDGREENDPARRTRSGVTRVLLVEDNPAEARLIEELLIEGGRRAFSIELAETLGEASAILKKTGADAVLLDLTLPDSTGLETVERVRAQAPDLPIVILTGLEDESMGTEAVRRGAQDYVSKRHANGELLARTLHYAVERQRVRTELQYVRVVQLRQQERMNRELAIRNKDLEEFAFIASHDLQEPLRKMILFSGLLEKDLGEPISANVERDLRFIRDGAERMQQLVDDLLSLSRADRSPKQRQQLALDQCVDAALQALELRIEQSSAALEREALPEVWGDRAVLTQLYLNLISNAIKFSRKDAPRIRITAENDGGHWTFGVADDGIGIKPEYAAQIFRPFQKLHGQDYEGSGIGLAICRRAVERHGGEIWVEPVPGGGSHFKFHLGQRTAPRRPSDAAIE